MPLEQHIGDGDSCRNELRAG